SGSRTRTRWRSRTWSPWRATSSRTSSGGARAPTPRSRRASGGETPLSVRRRSQLAIVDDAPVEDRHRHARILEAYAVREDVAGEDDDVGEHSWFERALALIVEGRIRAGRRVGVNRLGQRHPFPGQVPAFRFARHRGARGGDVQRGHRVHRDYRPVAAEEHTRPFRRQGLPDPPAPRPIPPEPIQPDVELPDAGAGVQRLLRDEHAERGESPDI